jgi:EVE domain
MIMGGHSANWLAVASAEHVRLGRGAGFMQVCHGKAAPLRRIQPGDHVVYYSPTAHFGGKDRLQAFTAIGVVQAGVPYQADMGGGFCPWRRDVLWHTARDMPIRPLLAQLEFTRDTPNWGYQLRFGMFKVSVPDMILIAEAMGAVPQPPEAFRAWPEGLNL